MVVGAFKGNIGGGLAFKDEPGGDAVTLSDNSFVLPDNTISPDDAIPPDDATSPDDATPPSNEFDLSSTPHKSIPSPNTLILVSNFPTLGSIPKTERIPHKHDHFHILQYHPNHFTLLHSQRPQDTNPRNTLWKKNGPIPPTIQSFPMKSTLAPIRSTLSFSPIIRSRYH